MILARSFNWTALLLSISILLGCGGSDHSSGSGSTPTPYAGFGYTDVLYRGTLTAKDASGHTATGSVGVTVSPDGMIVDAYGINSAAKDTLSYRLRADPAFAQATPPYTAVVDVPLQPQSEDNGNTVVKADAKSVAVAFTGASAINANIEAKVDTPDLTPGRPPAGTYAGTDYGRESLTGTLEYAGAATGSIQADGTFEFDYVAEGFSGKGTIRGKIVDDGTVTDVVLIRDDQVITLDSQVVTAYGTAKDFTLILRSPTANTAGDTYRLMRTEN